MESIRNVPSSIFVCANICFEEEKITTRFYYSCGLNGNNTMGGKYINKSKMLKIIS